MRENSIVLRYSDFERTKLKEKMYLASPMDIISAFGCEFKDDQDLRVEEYTFTDANGNTGELWIGTADKTVTIVINIDQSKVLSLHDQYLKSLKINEENNCLIIETDDTEIILTVWPTLAFLTTRYLQK